MRRYDISDEENMKISPEGEFVRFSDVTDQCEYFYKKFRYAAEDLMMLEADLLRALESLKARREIRSMDTDYYTTIAQLKEELAATYEELIESTGDGMDDHRAKRIAQLRSRN